MKISITELKRLIKETAEETAKKRVIQPVRQESPRSPSLALKKLDE